MEKQYLINVWLSSGRIKTIFFDDPKIMNQCYAELVEAMDFEFPIFHLTTGMIILPQVEYVEKQILTNTFK